MPVAEGYVLPKWFVWIVTLALTAHIPWASWVTGTIYRHDAHFATLEAAQFTANDGKQVWREIATIREDMAKLPTADRMDRFEERQQQVLQRLAVVESLLRAQSPRPADQRDGGN